MKIQNQTLISVDNSDIINGTFIIPTSVTTIGNDAFSNCTSLTSITIPTSVTTIGNYAFSHCTSLTSITIPTSVTTIGNSAFWNCNSLTSITIPKSVTTIGGYAFFNCTSLTSITIPESVTSIGNYAFWNCTSLTSITIPESVTSIGNYAFWNCTSLTSITIPESVTSIGYYAFWNCTSLTSINDLKVKCVDGYVFVIKSTKKVDDYTILKGYNYQLVEPEQLIYIANKGEFFAHGESIEKAIEDVNFKIYAEKLKSEPIDLEHVMTIQHYRIITGACDLGVKEWMAQNKVEENIKVKDLIPILKKTNAYGIQKFLNLIKN